MRYCRFLLLTLCLAVFPSVFSWSQELCSGNLGENIFADGDFGSGLANILPVDPGIAPGYTYTTNTPLPDGFYLITRHSGSWPTYPSWLTIPDNSTDPNGYMMVVNASFAPGAFYDQTIGGLCDNTTYEFSADIINMIRAGVADHIQPNISFYLNGELQFNTGNVPQDEKWHTYGFTFQTQPGETEVRLVLRNNAPGGIGNDLALDNISFRACGATAFVNAEETIFLCADENTPVPIIADINADNASIQWQLSRDEGAIWVDIPGATAGQVLHDDFRVGTYQYRYLSAGSEAALANFKCRIVSDVLTVEVLPDEYAVSDTICQGNTYLFGGQALETSGTYTADLISSRGCDSMVTLQLTVLPNMLETTLETTPPTCPTNSDGRISILNVRGGSPPYDYFLGTRFSSDGAFKGLPEGQYLLHTEDRFGCHAEDSVSLLVADPFRIDAGPDLLLDFGEIAASVQVTGTQPIDRLSWSPPDYLDCADCTQTSITGVRDLTYIITAFNGDDCQATDTLQVTLGDPEPRIYIPNVFSPNNDGINDRFQLFPRGNVVRSIVSFRIFDRWGNLLYEEKDQLPGGTEHGWNGQSNGKEVPDGAYLFSCELELFEGSRWQKAGAFTLIK